jgi:hypothetical protein
VFQKTQKFFSNDQQQKLTNQNENQLTRRYTPNAILDISAILKKVQKQKQMV